MPFPSPRHLPSAFRRFVDSEASGGIVLIACAAAALAAANSPLAGRYAALVGLPLGRAGLGTWVNDAPMALFFLLVGLEIKREMLHGQLRTWRARALPGLGALGGMLVPALVFTAVNWTHPASLRGWAIPSATDIAFALGVLSLLGDRVPASLRVFLTALAVLDDLGAVLIIAVFYAGDLSLPLLALAAVVVAALVVLNRRGVTRLWPYLVLGVPLWALVWRSGVHATVAGVLLALTIPAEAAPSRREAERSPLHRLEKALAPWVAYLILPVFAFVNAGVPLGSGGLGGLANPVTLGVAAGRQTAARGAAGGEQLGAGLRRRAVVRDRVHHEPVHRPARLRAAARVPGRHQVRRADRVAAVGLRGRVGAPLRAAAQGFGSGRSAAPRTLNSTGSGPPRSKRRTPFTRSPSLKGVAAPSSTRWGPSTSMMTSPFGPSASGPGATVVCGTPSTDASTSVSVDLPRFSIRTKAEAGRTPSGAGRSWGRVTLRSPTR